MLPAVIAAGANIIGGILGGQERDKDRQLSKEFAQQGIRWKVEDAKAAGLHPLAALGAQTSSFSPVSVGTPSLGEGVAGAGQDISRAINSTRDSTARVDAYSKTIQDLNIQRMGLENQLLGSQIAKINQAGIPPAMPTPSDRYLIDGQGNTPLVSNQAMKRNASAPGFPSQEGGAIPDLGYTRTPGGYFPVMSEQAKDRLEEDLIGNIQWQIRNRIMPFIDGGNPPGMALDNGESWVFDPGTQEYRRYKPNRGWMNPGFRYSR